MNLFKCPSCESVGFEQSVLGPLRCTYCDGTFGGNPPTQQDIEDYNASLKVQSQNQA